MFSVAGDKKVKKKSSLFMNNSMCPLKINTNCKKNAVGILQQYHEIKYIKK